MMRLILVLMSLIASVACLAQPGGGGDPGGGEPVPFSGLGILIASGALLGGKEIVRRINRTKRHNR